MFSRFARKKDPGQQLPSLEKAEQVQEQYWAPNAAERVSLLACHTDNLSWSELLRLHHLNCVELMSQPLGRTLRMNAEFDGSFPAPDKPGFKLFAKISRRLLALESPYRARHAEIWQGKGQEDGPATHRGLFRNASATHFGCLEVIRLDAQNQPQAIAFIPFDDLMVVRFVSNGLFRMARVRYDDDRPDETVMVPLLYGVSWFTRQRYDQDGSMTRFCCHFPDDAELLSMGIGHQDFEVEGERGRAVFGLGSVSQLATALDLRDPRLDQKCRKRGLDPDELRKDMESRPE